MRKKRKRGVNDYRPDGCWPVGHYLGFCLGAAWG